MIDKRCNCARRLKIMIDQSEHNTSRYDSIQFEIQVWITIDTAVGSCYFVVKFK